MLIKRGKEWASLPELVKSFKDPQSQDFPIHKKKVYLKLRNYFEHFTFMSFSFYLQYSNTFE